MAGVTEGGGGYDYKQSLLPTDGMPLRLEGMRGGGRKPATEIDMAKAAAMLEMARKNNLHMEVSFEGPFENGNPTQMCITVYERQQESTAAENNENVPELEEGAPE
jgi:hypothetical protein